MQDYRDLRKEHACQWYMSELQGAEERPCKTMRVSYMVMRKERVCVCQSYRVLRKDHACQSYRVMSACVCVSVCVCQSYRVLRKDRARRSVSVTW